MAKEETEKFKVNSDAINAAIIDSSILARQFSDHKHNGIILKAILDFLLPIYYENWKPEENDNDNEKKSG